MKKFCPDCRTAFYSDVGYCDACGYQFEIARKTQSSEATEAQPQSHNKLLILLSALVGLIGATIPFFIFGG